MAYILGFIAADGCVYKRNDRKNDQYLFNITTKDREHLLRMRNVMGSLHTIGKKRGAVGSVAYYVNISSGQMAADLIHHGIIPRKSQNLQPIRVPKKYRADFVRGFFDGDGSVYIYTVNGTPQLKSSFVGASKCFIEWLNVIICEEIDIPIKTVHCQQKNRRSPLYTIHFYVHESTRLSNWMYRENPKLFLKRKRDLFDAWKSQKRRGYKKKNYPSKVGWKLNASYYAKASI